MDPPQKRRRLLYDRADLQQAFEATLGGMSAYRAAKIFSVPPTTLRDRISGRVASDARVGHDTIFTSEEEEKLYNHITYMAETGNGYNKTSIQYMAKDYADSLSKQTKGEKLSDNWFYGFTKRWPDLQITKPQKSAKSASRETLDSYFKELEVVLSTNKIKKKPWKVFKIDETGMNTEHSPRKKFKKDTAPQNITPPRSETVTVIAARNAAESTMPKSKEFISSDSESGSDEPKPKKKKVEKKKEEPKESPKKAAEKPKSKSEKGPDGEQMFQLSRMRFATVSEFRGKVMVGIREYYEKDGDLRPGKKGISLPIDQWNKLKDQIEDIDQAVKDLS